MVTVFLVGPYGVEPPSQMTPRLQRDSPSEANHRPEVGIGDAVASIAFVQWLTVREHLHFPCCWRYSIAFARMIGSQNKTKRPPRVEAAFVGTHGEW